MPRGQNNTDSERTNAITGIAIHHSASANHGTGKPTGRAFDFFNYHVNTLGWDHGGYNYVICPNGEVEYALDDQAAAYHAGFNDPDNSTDLEYGQYWNNHYLAICVSGWFDCDRTYRDAFGSTHLIPNRYTSPTETQLTSLLALIVFLRQKYAIPIENIVGHRELTGCQTVCPGANFNFDELRQKILRLESQAAIVVVHKKIPLPILASDHQTTQRKTAIKRFINGFLRLATAAGIVVVVIATPLAWTQSPTFLNLIWRISLLFILLLEGLVFTLRWINPPTSAFMFETQRALRRDGQLDTINHQWINYERIAPTMRLAVIIAEDQQFPKNAGFNWGHMWRAWQANRQNAFTKGGSSISQQLVKNLFLWPDRTYFRKAIEALITLLVEVTWPKRRILEIYLNIVQFDQLVFGVGTAAWHFFQKEAANLDSDEAALLAAVLPNPVSYQVKAPSLTVRRRHIEIMAQMTQFGLDYLKLID